MSARATTNTPWPTTICAADAARTRRIALNNRGTLYLRKGALQSALDDFNAAVKSNPNLYIAHTTAARVLTINKDYDGALADFAEAERIDPAAPQIHELPLHHLHRDGPVRRGHRRLQRRDRESPEIPSTRWSAAPTPIWARATSMRR